MSWDIHGNPLKPGHCEVHPHVAEMYPCTTCIADTREKRKDLRIAELEKALRFVGSIEVDEGISNRESLVEHKSRLVECKKMANRALRLGGEK